MSCPECGSDMVAEPPAEQAWSNGEDQTNHRSCTDCGHEWRV